jgi:hypothetical protein
MISDIRVFDLVFLVSAALAALAVPVGLYFVYKDSLVCRERVVTHGGECLNGSKLSIEGYVAVCRCIK